MSNAGIRERQGAFEMLVEEMEDQLAWAVLHHIDTMYPEMWKGVSRSARVSVENTIRQKTKVLLLSEDMRAFLR